MTASYRVRPLDPGEVIWSRTATVAARWKHLPAHLAAGKVIERDGQIAAVLRGHSLIYEHEDLGVISEIVGSEDDAVARMHELIDGVDA